MNQRRRWRRGSAAAAAVLIRNVGCSTFKTRPVQLQWSCQNQNHPCIFHHVLNTLPRQAIIARDIHSPDHENRESGHHNLHRASEIRNALKNGVSYRALAVQCHRFGPAGDPAISLRGIQTATGPDRIWCSSSQRAAFTAFSARSSKKADGAGKRRYSANSTQHGRDPRSSWRHRPQDRGTPETAT